MIVLIWLVVLAVVVLLYLRQVYTRFSRHGVKNRKVVPILGDMYSVMFKTEAFPDVIVRTYTSFPEDRFVGRFELLNPMIVPRDIELIKKITIKDFEHFLDHRSLVNDEVDPFFGRNLFSLKGQEWKDMRSTLSPAFTSSKIRLMVPLMVEVGDRMIQSLKTNMLHSKADYIDIDSKDMTTRYANDVIASCAFGLKVDSHTEVDNEFYHMGKQAATFSVLQVLKFILFSTWPIVMKKFKMRLFSFKVEKFFKELVLNTMKEREMRNIIRPDMIHLLMEAKKGQLTHDTSETKDVDAGFATVEESDVGKTNIDRVWSDNDLIAQGVLFFIAGFETVSSAMSFLLYELAVNPDIQERLYQEIKENEVKMGGKFDYNSIINMTYLDMVVSESLRLWPPAIALDRICVKDYNLGKPNKDAKKDYYVRKGESLSIPVWAIHRDPQFYENPDKFDPERFSDENKHKINPFTYIPFGVGPRNCIGSRFALCEVKVMVYQLLQHMEISPSDKTRIPAKVAKDSINLRMEGGHWIRLKSRN